MEPDNLIIVDNIPLFNPQIEIQGTKYQYNEIEKKSAFLTKGKLYFFTADIDSITDYTKKITTVFEKLRPMYLFLADRNSKRKIWFYQIPRLLVNNRYEWRHRQWLITRIQKEIQTLGSRKKQIKTVKNGEPAYLKLTLSYGVEIGGMVAHSAGILSVLQKKHPAMPVFTTDYLPENIDKKHVKYISLHAFRDYPELKDLYFNISAYREIVSDLADKDISYIYQRCSLHNFVGVKLADKLHVPFVLEFNSSSVWTMKNWGNRLLHENIANDIELLNLNRADLIVCVSDELKQSLIDRGIEEKKILVNYNGVDIEKYNPDCRGDRIRKKFHIEDRIVIGFSGSFNLFHGAEKLAAAYGELIKRRPDLADKVYLLFIGDGVRRKFVERIIKQFRTGDIAGCIGTVPFEEVQDYLAACDILAAPHVPNKDKSPFFGSPTKLFEYMAMGKAIIASDLNQIGEILDSGCALLVEPGNTDELGKAIERLAADKDLRIRLGRNAREKAVAEYTWEKHVERIQNKIKELFKEFA